MSEKHLQRHSHQITEDAWWYEEKTGISVVIYWANQGASQIAKIPWRQIRAALKRLDKP